MIVSASRRTDLACCFPEWLMRRLRAGTVLVRNPFRPSQISRVTLTPDVVDCIVLWTKDPAPLLPFLPELESMGHRFCFHFTLTPYDSTLERGLRDKRAIVETFQLLGGTIGRHRMHWRYDPIIVNNAWTMRRHEAAFARLCELLWPYAADVTISFVDLYPGRTTSLQAVSAQQMEALCRSIGQIAGQYGLPVRACCEATDFTRFGILPGSCLSREALEAACGYSLALRPDRAQRKGCGCMQSVDIGAYNTCRNGCVYCYATGSASVVDRQNAAHDPDGELLVGRPGRNDTIKQRPAVSLRAPAPLFPF